MVSLKSHTRLTGYHQLVVVQVACPVEEVNLRTPPIAVHGRSTFECVEVAMADNKHNGCVLLDNRL